MNEIFRYVLMIVLLLFTLTTIAAWLIWLERRMLALWQDRYGPNRAGPFGLLIVAADTLKLFFKEDWIPLLPTK
jgi:NADH-quinone oxidoreductase subunit H